LEASDGEHRTHLDRRRWGASVEQALAAYVSRYAPRATWVQQESRAVAESISLPPNVRNAALRAHGDQLLRQRFAPLLSPP
jgi:hypothetical protein